MRDPYGEAWVEWMGNLARTLVRDMLREPVYVSVPMKDNEAWVGPEWLRVGPDDLGGDAAGRSEGASAGLDRAGVAEQRPHGDCADG